MVDTGRVSDDKRRSRICLRLGNSLNGLYHICTHCDVCYINIAVGHCNSGKILLLGLLTAGSKLCHSTGRSRLGRLSACVGVYLSIEYHNIDIFSGSKNMIQSAESDIICPTVTTENPLALLS